MPKPVSEQQFLDLYNVISTEVENAFVLYYQFEELNRLWTDDIAIFEAIHRHIQFWLAYRHSIQASLLITVTRLFDTTDKAKTIPRLVTAVANNLQLFDEPSLRRRKANGGNPPWLDDFMKDAWLPTSSGDFRSLQVALKPHTKRINTIYRPIRNNVLAHRIMDDIEAAHALFPQTNRKELGETLIFLRDLKQVIWDLYYNGKQPILHNLSLDHEIKAIKAGIEAVLRALVQVGDRG